MFNFTPLLGAQSASPASQSILEFDGGIKILIDVGWDESFDIQKLKELEKYVQKLFKATQKTLLTHELGMCRHFPSYCSHMQPQRISELSPTAASTYLSSPVSLYTQLYPSNLSVKHCFRTSTPQLH